MIRIANGRPNRMRRDRRAEEASRELATRRKCTPNSYAYSVGSAYSTYRVEDANGAFRAMVIVSVNG